jgi:hypothetical protein
MATYYCVITQMPFQESDAGLSDIYRRAVPGSDIHRVLCKFMLTRGLKYVGLTAPSARPSSYVDKAVPNFHEHFPEDYSRDLDTLLGHGGSVPTVLIINQRSKEATAVKVTDRDTYNRVLLSMFVQSVQQLNRTSRMLFRMVGLPPKFGMGTFVSSETTQCCFKNLVAKLKTTPRGEFEINFFVKDHIHHSSLLDLSSIAKWFNSESAVVS